MGEKNRILEFYNGEGVDHRGRYLEDIVEWSDERLEYTHDYIQWLFPLTEGSAVNPDAPILDADTIAEFRARTNLGENLRRSFVRMLRFYGLKLDPAPLAVTKLESFPDRARDWLWAGNHNHLRITRILKCLRLLGLEAESRAFFECLRQIYESERASDRPRITDISFRFWTAAANP